jgi:hypothetical protein
VKDENKPMKQPKDQPKAAGRRRWPACALLVALAAGGGGGVGCSTDRSFTLNPFARPHVPESETLSGSQWAQLKRENQQRLAGEGIPAPGAATRPTGQPGNEFKEFTEFVKFAFYTFPKQTINFYLGNTPGRYARMMEDDQSGDQRRSGILKLVSDYPFARVEPYTKRYWQIAQGDPSTLVRVAAVRALDRSRDKSVVPIAIRYLDDANPLLRLEAAKALGNLPDDRAVAPLIRHMGTTIEVRGEGNRPEPQVESRDVRVACADALRNFATKDVARALIEALREKEFEVSWQARKSLILMTGHDFRYDQAKWRDYLSKTDNPFG